MFNLLNLSGLSSRLLTAIASMALVLSVSPGVMAQFYQTGSPGFNRSIYIPSAQNRNTRSGHDHGHYNPGYSRHQSDRGDRHLTIINGGQNCLNCRVNEPGDRRGTARYRHDNHRPYGRSGTIIYQR